MHLSFCAFVTVNHFHANTIGNGDWWLPKVSCSKENKNTNMLASSGAVYDLKLFYCKA